ncbi:hypothetical protein BT63DRAFT_461460 [Microthyrium microscopicum]|uniref:Cupredoxin n=1 Tax=Microthyrium microscopicum TaxID=703497 RepID=A0A6A6TVK0_9PEZI|nr:hypothetical protein BT63DRAFT_461460 [Microthyrium microscopicum]
MKTSILSLLLPVLANGAAVQLEPRQSGMMDMLKGMTKGMATKAYKIEPLTPRNPAAKRIRMTWGPLKLRGANSTTKVGSGMSMDPGGTGHNFLVDTDFPTDVTLLDGVVEVQGMDFKRVTLDQNVYTHHYLVYDLMKPQKPSFTCANGKSISYVPIPGTVVLGGAAEDAEAHYATPTMKKTGYYVKKDTPILMNLDVVNYNPADIDVYASADIEYIPGKPEGMLDASPVFVPVSACDKGMVIPGIVMTPKGQNKFTLNSTSIIASEDSLMFMFRGHMHDGGSNIEVKINDKVACNSKAIYGGPGHVGKTHDGKSWETIGAMVTCPEGVMVKKGDKIDIQANYDLLAHPAREAGHGHGGGMLGGMLGGLLGGGDGMAEQMAVSIIYVAPLNPKA